MSSVLFGLPDKQRFLYYYSTMFSADSNFCFEEDLYIDPLQSIVRPEVDLLETLHPSSRFITWFLDFYPFKYYY